MARLRHGLSLFAAVVHLDRRPIDPAGLAAPGLLAGLRPRLRIVSPDGAPHVALLRADDPSPMRARETSAIETLAEGGRPRCWLVGRIRLDGRGDLAARLGLATGAAPPSDAGLCLRAYARWGEGFLDRLAGDFAFVLWDAARGKLLGVRDQLGVRSLYHARTGETLLAGDALDWIVARPGVGRDLDDYWIADYLTLGYCLAFERTAYRSVQRLAPAHFLTVGSDVSSRRYWQLEIGEPLFLRDRRLYAEMFRDRVREAVADRLPPGRIGISMSGGIDSALLAASAVDASGDPARVTATCFHFERLIPDDELRYARLTADHLGIELDAVALDDNQFDPRWRELPAGTPEPSARALRGRLDRAVGAPMAGRAAVWFEGEGPDNALKFERGPYFSWLRRRGAWGHLISAAWSYARAKGVRHLDRTLKRYALGRGTDLPDVTFPPWLEPGLAARLRLAERLAESRRAGEHPWHPEAMASFADPVWQPLFAEAELDEAELPYVWRHPLLDLRVLHFMLAVPPVPWAYRKLLLREAMRHRLPAAVLERDKAPLRAHPLWPAMRGHKLPPLEAAPALARWIDLPRLAREGTDSASLEPLLAAHALDHWLATRSSEGRPT